TLALTGRREIGRPRDGVPADARIRPARAVAAAGADQIWGKDRDVAHRLITIPSAIASLSLPTNWRTSASEGGHDVDRLIVMWFVIVCWLEDDPPPCAVASRLLTTSPRLLGSRNCWPLAMFRISGRPVSLMRYMPSAATGPPYWRFPATTDAAIAGAPRAAAAVPAAAAAAGASAGPTIGIAAVAMKAFCAASAVVARTWAAVAAAYAAPAADSAARPRMIGLTCSMPICTNDPTTSFRIVPANALAASAALPVPSTILSSAAAADCPRLSMPSISIWFHTDSLRNRSSCSASMVSSCFCARFAAY